MKRYDDIVVGSGISGLTTALFLAMNGRRVLLIEKAPRIGGSMRRFYKEGYPFDTGFHFTGGLHEGGMLDEMLSALGLRGLIRPIYLSRENANCFYFASEDKVFEMPYGIKELKGKLKGYFPGEEEAIERYFEKVASVCRRTTSMRLGTLTAIQNHIDEDFLTLDEVLSGLTRNRILKALLSGFAMCYGVKPGDISFASHSRICLGLYESVARVEGGGEAFIKAFRERFKEYEIDVLTGRCIEKLSDIENRRVGLFLLDGGEEIQAENCIFTIHPMEMLKSLPKEHTSRAFAERVSSFEPSAGFFAIFAALGPEYEEPGFDSTIFSIFPHTDLNLLLDPSHKGDPPLVIIRSVEEAGGNKHKIINALEVSFPEHVKKWSGSKTGERPEAYLQYKKQRAEDITGRILKAFPQYGGHLRVVDSASVLTFRDYLNNHNGSAYGVKQKAGQINLIGRLPLRNLYAAGQSAVLPGIIGAMMSAFIVGRSILRDEQYRKFLSLNLRT